MIFPSSVRQAVSKVTPDVQILWIHNLIEKQYGLHAVVPMERHEEHA